MSKGSTSPRVRIAMTTSSSAALPARSPMPFTVHSIWRAPACTPASEFATARPRSLWQCTENTALSASGTRSRTADQRAVFLRHGVAHRIGDVDRGGAGLDRRLDAAAQEVVLGAGGVLRRPLDVLDQVARPRDLARDELEHLLGRFLELELHVHGAGRDERVDAPALGVPHRFAGAVDVLLGGAREPAHDGVLDARRRSPRRPRSRPSRRSGTPPR